MVLYFFTQFLTIWLQVESLCGIKSHE